MGGTRDDQQSQSKWQMNVETEWGTNITSGIGVRGRERERNLVAVKLDVKLLTKCEKDSTKVLSLRMREKWKEEQMQFPSLDENESQGCR